MMERRGYHHGNLRAALLEAARILIAKKGHSEFTLAEAARMASVSTAAPYRHFSSRAHLVRNLATIGYARLRSQIRGVRRKGLDPFEELLAIGQAYLDFSINHKAEYIAMFECNIPFDATPAISRHVRELVGEIGDAAGALLRDMPELERPPGRLIAYNIWSMAHGLVGLLRNPDEHAQPRSEIEEILENGLRIYLCGLQASR